MPNNKLKHEYVDDDVLTFAIDGRMVLTTTVVVIILIKLLFNGRFC